MATTQGQDVIRCHLCPSPVEHHCNFCHVDLCLSCVPKHMADKSKRHEVVDYTSRKKDTVFLSTCHTHKNYQCETYCLDCKKPICIQCLMGSHKRHKFTNINDVFQKQKQRIIDDIKELENVIVPKYRNISSSTTASGSDKVLRVIKEQEQKICKAVREVSIELNDEITKRTKEDVRKSKEAQSLADKAEKELSQLIKKNKDILIASDSTAILNYESRNGRFRTGPELPRLSCPNLSTGVINKDQIMGMFGFLHTGIDQNRHPDILKVMADPKLLHTIQSPYTDMPWLWRVQCMRRDAILITGNDQTIKQMDMSGSILKTIYTNDNVWALTLNLQQEPVFSLSAFSHKNTDIYLYTKDRVKVLFSIPDWCPVGLCYTVNGDLLVSMRSMDKKQSRLVRYSGTTEIQKIQFDSQGLPLFSSGAFNVLPLAENGNGDICVSECAGNEVVVVDSCGSLRFKYKGNLSKQSKYTEFIPFHIATDINTQIVVCDSSNNIVHVIDCDGHFLCYIERLSNGGLSIDTNHNLVIGDKHSSGKIQIVKYLN